MEAKFSHLHENDDNLHPTMKFVSIGKVGLRTFKKKTINVQLIPTSMDRTYSILFPFQELYRSQDTVVIGTYVKKL